MQILLLILFVEQNPYGTLNHLPVRFPFVAGFATIILTLHYFPSKESLLFQHICTSTNSQTSRLTGDVFEHAEHFALWRHSLDVRMVLQSQQVARRSLADVDQLKVTGEVRCWIFSGNDVPFKHAITDVPQGTADVQAACLG